MKILGIDASLNCPGFAIVEILDGEAKLIDTFSVNNNNSNGKEKSIGKKLYEISRMLHFIISKFNPDEIVRERGFSRYAAVTQKLFRVVGALDVVAYDYKKADIIEITPKEIKVFMTGDGTASKDLVADALSLYVGSYVYNTNDESDAVAVVLSWALKCGYIKSKLVKNPRKRSGRPKKTSTHQEFKLPNMPRRIMRIQRYRR